MKPLTADSPVFGMTSTMPRITRPYSTAPMAPEPTIMTGTSRRGLRISSDAPLDTSNPTHKNTKIPIAVRKPVTDGFRSPAAEAPAGRPCWTRNAMNSTVNRTTTAILTKVPMLGPHYRRAVVHPGPRHLAYPGHHIGRAGLPPQRAWGGTFSPFIKKESGWSCASWPMVTP